MKSAKFSSQVFSIIFISLITEIFCAPQDNANNRHCESLDETFFNSQCLPIGSIDYCPSNTELYDGPQNEGFCDCVDNPSKPILYSDETGECYFHNTQGPCLDGEWFVLKNDIPQCEPVPEGCPADGQHFYGSPDETMSEQCWKIGSQGPCLPQEIIVLGYLENYLVIFCESTRPSQLEASSLISTGFNAPCRPGTRRNRFGQCTQGFIG